MINKKHFMFFATSNTNYGYLSEVRTILSNYGHRTTFLSNKIKVSKEKTEKFDRLSYSSIARNGHNLGVMFLLKTVAHTIILLYWLFFFVLFIRIKRINTILVPGDRERGKINALIKAGTYMRIPTICIPNAKAGLSNETLVYRRKVNGYILPESKFFTKWLFDQSILDQKTKNRFLIFGLEYSLALFLTGMLPKNAWNRQGGGGSSYCFVDNETTKYEYSKNFISEKYIVTGLLDHDSIFKSKQRYANSSKVALLNLPNWFESETFEWDTAKEHQIKLLNICVELRQFNYEIVVTLHPTMDLRDYKWIKSEYQFELSEKPLSSILGKATIYICHYGSSTINWASDMKIPTFILDDLPLMPSPIIADKNLRIIVSNGSDLIEKVSKVKDSKSIDLPFKKSIIDGKAKKRIIENILDITSRKDLGYPSYVRPKV